ncbi:hypothetical protein F8388_023301 [Cannabis sativa]|uniref:Seed maturation protein PM41 n=2 Tax=Cannabis sativa TaxID=3483 RepID=A0A7J6HDR8_CANSA|nr:hypothetical protein F8388_026779 [Cannabis sativa]KAF4393497.1 hypothetical protein F8388_023301 [Cannabis sativa]KAF4396544.1 hypothetical protein G4B88_028858 [Cannabis sativa]
MSGAQGAQPKNSKTATTYESTQGGENRTKIELKSQEDEGGIQIDKIQDKVPDAAGKGGPVFGAANDDKNQDLGVTGTASE